MSTTITGIVTKGVVVPNSPLPEGARVEIRLMSSEVPSANPLLHFPGHLDPNDPLEQEFVEELARRRQKDLEQTVLIQESHVVPPEISDPVEQKLLLKSVAESMRRNPLPANAPRFSSEELNARR